MSLNVAIRADASVEIGTGHVMRCLTLAEGLRAMGHEVTFVMRDLVGNMCARVAAQGFVVHRLPPPSGAFRREAGPVHAAWAGVPSLQDATETAAALRGASFDWLVLDHYSFDAEWERLARPDQARVLVIDDLADRRHDCDLLLDQSFGRHSRDYTDLVGARTQRLIGPSYALLRPDFEALRSAALERRNGQLRHILIAMGGIDAPDVTSTVLDALPSGYQVTVVMGSAAPALDKVREKAARYGATLLVDTPDMADLMAKADLAIGGIGGSTWERCALGLPSLMVVMADNQATGAAAIAATGAAILIGSAGDPDLAQNLRAAIADVALGDRLRDMSAQAASLCDGRGCPRVLRALSAPVITLRPARMEDAETVWHWRVPLAGSTAFRVPEIPPLDAHLDWFRMALTNPAHRLYMAEAEAKTVGHLRLDDLADHQGHVTASFLIAPEARGLGIGTAILIVVADQARRLGMTTLIADVHEDNQASLALSYAFGYVRVGQDGPFIRLALAL